MKNDKIVSKCCFSDVKIGGEGLTHYYICSSCKKACDIIKEKRHNEK